MSLMENIASLFGSGAAAKAGNAARDKGDWGEAALHYARHVKARPNDTAIWMQLGHAYKEQNLLDKAEEAYSKGLLLEPDDADAHIMMGHLKKQMGNLRKAASHYDDAVNLAPESLDARIQVAFTEKDLGNIDTALNHYKVINKMDPTNEEVIGLIKRLTSQLRAKDQSSGGVSSEAQGGTRAVYELETTVRAMASEIHRLRAIIEEVETKLIDSEKSQLLAYQGLRQEFQRIEKKQIDLENPTPFVAGRFNEMLTQIESAQSKISQKKTSN